MTVNIYPVTDIESMKEPKDGHYGYLLQAVEERNVLGYRTAWKECHADTQGALIMALTEAAGRILDADLNVLVLSDNKPVLDGVLNIHKWQQDGWRRSRGRRILRIDAWKKAAGALEGKRFAAQQVKTAVMQTICRQIRQKEER